MPRIVEINEVEKLAPIRSAWDALLTKTPAASFFQSLRWLEIYWRHFAPGQRLRVLVVEDNGE
ncbi:MAG: cellulose biosynthesis protein, partial [Planctomycetaceae bacterium]|nr:cellulose biosynthesis protein [Planctomycetaceae bacterium]